MSANKDALESPQYPFGGSGIPETMFQWIRKNTRKGSLILEFGAGQSSTGNLTPLYQMVTVEQSAAYMNRFKGVYVHAPFVNGWYDLKIVQDAIRNLKPKTVIVDGPSGTGTRYGFMKVLELLPRTAKIVVNNINRAAEAVLFKDIVDFRAVQAKKAKQRQPRVFISDEPSRGISQWGVVG